MPRLRRKWFMLRGARSEISLHAVVFRLIENFAPSPRSGIFGRVAFRQRLILRLAFLGVSPAFG